MKLKVINRDPEQFTRERSQDLRKVHKNLDPALHPFEKAVEYTRCGCSTAEHRRAQQDHLSHCGTAALSLVGQEPRPGSWYSSHHRWQTDSDLLGFLCLHIALAFSVA